MISPEIGKAGFLIGIFVTMVSGGLLLVVERGSAEFTISLLTFGIGILFILLIIVLVRLGTKKW
ncbi:MAG: hypothetical protein KF893_10950 [Caldilineaceae bacterium]|nr:hypothetical protein [Caldilineaceae bacterium]